MRDFQNSQKKSACSWQFTEAFQILYGITYVQDTHQEDVSCPDGKKGYKQLQEDVLSFHKLLLQCGES